MSYYRIFLPGEPTTVLCDRCGFAKHHRPSRPGDPRPFLLDDVPEWAWDPEDDWRWAPRWSSAPYPCAYCGEDANARIPLCVIVRELRAKADAP